MKYKTLLVALFFSAFAFAQTQETDVVYGTHGQQKYDLNTPAEYDENTPIVVYIHGGGWIVSSKNHYRNVVNTLFNKGGMITVNMNYRMPTETNTTYVFPDQINDITSVISHVRNYLNLPNNPIILAGNSAGGHLSAWYYLNQESIGVPIHSVIPITPPYKSDVMVTVGGVEYPYAYVGVPVWLLYRFMSPEVRGDMTDMEALLYGSPHTYANPELDNILAIFHTNDSQVPLHQYEAMQSDYPNVDYLLLPGHHTAFMTTYLEEATNAMHEFITRSEECTVPTNVTLTRLSHTTASFEGANPNFHYQGSANRAGRPLRPYPMYGMNDMVVPHIQTGLVPAFDYDVWLRTICSDGTYSEWSEAYYLPRFEVPRPSANTRYFNIQGQEISPRNLRGIIIINDGNKSYKIYKK